MAHLPTTFPRWSMVAAAEILQNCEFRPDEIDLAISKRFVVICWGHLMLLMVLSCCQNHLFQRPESYSRATSPSRRAGWTGLRSCKSRASSCVRCWGATRVVSRAIAELKLIELFHRLLVAQLRLKLQATLGLFSPQWPWYRHRFQMLCPPHLRYPGRWQSDRLGDLQEIYFTKIKTIELCDQQNKVPNSSVV